MLNIGKETYCVFGTSMGVEGHLGLGSILLSLVMDLLGIPKKKQSNLSLASIQTARHPTKKKKKKKKKSQISLRLQSELLGIPKKKKKSQIFLRLHSELLGISKNSQIFIRLQSELLGTSMASQVSPRLQSNLSRLLRARIISVSASSNSLHGLHDPSSVWCRPRVFSASLSLILTFLWPFLGSL
jgi:hypothetical protein